MKTFHFGYKNGSIIEVPHCNEKKAIFNGSSHWCGPSFGKNDLRLYQSSEGVLKIYCQKSFYEKRIRKPGTLFYEDFEVFQIV